MLVQLPNPKILGTPYHYSAAWDAPAASRRQAEFAAGRFCAAKALALARPGISYDLPTAANGSPRWPAGFVGSITHTEGFVSAAVDESDRLLNIGIDSEKLAAPEIAEALNDLVIQNHEQRLLAALSCSAAHGRLLIFSAKESVYKCLQPLVQSVFDFSAVCIEAIDILGGTFTFRLRESLHRDFPASFSAQGRFEFSGHYVHTAVELEKMPSLGRGKTGEGDNLNTLRKR